MNADLLFSFLFGIDGVLLTTCALAIMGVALNELAGELACGSSIHPTATPLPLEQGRSRPSGASPPPD